MNGANMSRKILVAASALGLVLLSLRAFADDKDLLKRRASKPNIMIVFGNSQTTTQPLVGNYSMWDGDADSPGSKMGASKRVIKQFVADRGGSFNIGLSTFSHDPPDNSIRLYQKHWLYSPITIDFPRDTWQEPIGTIERWGDYGQGPCSSLTPTCASVSPMVVLDPSTATITGNFFGSRGNGTATINISATERVNITLTNGEYGDAFTDGSLSALTLGDHSMAVQKTYQLNVAGVWTTPGTTLAGSPNPVTVFYRPSPTLLSDQFFTRDPDAGDQIGFIADVNKSGGADLDVNANCAGWEFQSNSAPLRPAPAPSPGSGRLLRREQR
jgi:hypothetical protein